MNDKPKSDIQENILKEQIRVFKEQFDELDKINVRTIPENMFVYHFLPFFSGEVKENSQEIITNWLTIAGSAVNPVNILDTNGRIVAQVPPMQNNNALDPATIDDSNLAYAAKEAKAMAGLSPVAAQNILSNQLSVKLSTMTKELQISNVEHEKKWNDLLTHYGKVPPTDKSKDSTSTDEGDIFGF